MNYDYSLLRGIIKTKCGSEKNFAKKLGITSSTFSKKLKSKYGFSQSEMVKTCEILDLNLEKNLAALFFSNKCCENTTK